MMKALVPGDVATVTRIPPREALDEKRNNGDLHRPCRILLQILHSGLILLLPRRVLLVATRTAGGTTSPGFATGFPSAVILSTLQK
jgi:hypothetical protein